MVHRWLLLSACMVAMMAIANLQYAWTLFTVPLARNLGAALSSVQIAFTLFILAETWLVPIEGVLIDRFGARRVVSVGGVLIGACWVGAGSAQTLSSLYFWYAVGGAGAGAVYGASIGLALKWFPDRRGLAVGLTAGAYGFGTALTVLPIQHVIESRGYAAAFITWGLIQGIIVVLAAQLMQNPPLGQAPPVPRQRAVLTLQSSTSKTPFEMIKSPVFWLMYLMMALVAFGGLMVTAQLRPIAATVGMDATPAWFGINTLGVALVLDRLLNGISRPFWGVVSDRFGRYETMTMAFAMEAVAILLLLENIDDPVLFVVCSGMVFFGWGEIYSLFPAAIADVFGPKYATTNYGIQYTAKGTASIFAGWGAALLVESTGSWEPAFWVAIGCDLLAAVMAYAWLRPLATKALAAAAVAEPASA